MLVSFISRARPGARRHAPPPGRRGHLAYRICAISPRAVCGVARAPPVGRLGLGASSALAALGAALAGAGDPATRAV